MGYQAHHTIVVTGYGSSVEEAHAKAVEIGAQYSEEGWTGNFAALVSPIIDGQTNGQRSFFIAPDGSKEGWETSDLGDHFRDEFIEWLRSPNVYVSWVEVLIDNDDGMTGLLRHGNED